MGGGERINLLLKVVRGMRKQIQPPMRAEVGTGGETHG